MSSNQKGFLLVLALYTIGNLVAIPFTNFYLWQQTNQFRLLLSYNMVVFLAMASGGLIAGLVSKWKDSIFTYALSMIFYVLQLSLLLVLDPKTTSHLVIIGLVSGLAIGMQSFSYNFVFQELTPVPSRARFLGIKSALLNLIVLVFSPLIALSTQILGTYIPLFILSIVVFLVIIVLLVGIKLPPISLVRNKRLFSSLPEIPDAKAYLQAKFLYGIEDGLFWVTLGIITLEFFGSLARWGIFSAVITMISIVASYIYGRVITLKYANYTAVLATLLFAGATVVLSANWNLGSFIFYQIVFAILGVSMAVDLDSFFGDILDESPEAAALRSDYNALGEAATNLGRLVPTLALLLLGVGALSDWYLRIAFLFVAPIPLFIMHILSGTQLLISARRA